MILGLPDLRMGPAEFGRFLEQQGPTFIKVGQYLALRPDLIAEQYCDELLRLTDRVTPFPAAEAMKILADELGRDPSEVFFVLDPRAEAAGSLAQVHRGRLHSGEEVAVKILRPGVEDRVRQDLRKFRLLARLIEISGARAAISPREVVDELSEWMFQELDLRRELNNMTRLRELSGGRERIPRPFPELSTSRVLVMEHITGVSLADVLESLQSDDVEDPRRLRELGFEGPAVARELVLTSLRQMFHYRFFHGDLHPGNILVLPGGGIGFVDFGLCSDLDPTVRENQVRYLSAVYSGESERMYKAVSELLVPGQATDWEVFRQDFLAATRNLDLGSPASDGERERSPIAQYLIRIMRAARDNDLKVPTGILAMYRTLLTVETLAVRLGLGDGLRQVGRGFFARLQKEDTLRKVTAENLQPVFLSLFDLLREGPAKLNQVLTEIASGELSVRVDAAESKKARQSRNRRSRLIAASIVSVGVALLLTRPTLPGLFGISLAWPLGIALAALYLLVLVLSRRLD